MHLPTIIFPLLYLDQVEQFQRDGFVVLEGFFDPQELTTWRENVEVFFNRQRLHSALGYLSPTNYEEVYALQQAT